MGTRVQYRPSSAVPGGISSATYSRTHATSARDSPHKDAAAAVSSAPAIIEQSKRDAAGGVYTKRFLKGAILGKGGFAKCYRVTDMDTKEEWACKIIEKKSLTKQRHKTKLQTEIKIHRSISHRHVVKFYDVFEDKDNVYILMEVCPNMTMLELVKRKKRLSESDTRRYMLQMLDGVRHMHEKKVIHRDLKLGNIFLGKGNEVKIGDFGLACKLLFDGERKKTLCGTPNYIAPEVLDGKNGHSYEVDTWSIGVVLYTCLVGKPPFETQDVKSTYKLIKANSYSFPERLEISEVAKRLVRRVLQSNPEARPTIDEVLADEFFLGQGLALISQAGTRTKDFHASSTQASAPASTNSASEWRAPLRPMSMKHDAYNTPQTVVGGDATANKKPKTDSVTSRATSSGSEAASALERNIATAESGASAYRPYSSSAADDASGTASPTRRVIKQLGSCTLSARGPSPQKPPLSARNVIDNATSVRPLSSAVSATGGNLSRPLSAVISGSETASAASTLDRDSSAKAPSKVAAARGGAAAVEDEEALREMHAGLVTALQRGVDPVTAPAGAALPLPSVWVSRWVDYSKKYGLGYRLSSGAHGVFFNDATKILLGDDHDTFDYIERMRGEDGVKFDQRRQSSVSGHTQDLAKKVTLMKHFKNYLDEQPGETDSGEQVGSPNGESGRGVYVRKWMRTRHSVIFRLSNNAFQVSFLDDTEVFLWAAPGNGLAGDQWITFKSRGTPRRTLTAAQAVSLPDVAKRVKYVRDILAQLVA